MRHAAAIAFAFTALLTWGRAASAQQETIIEIEDEPAEPAPQPAKTTPQAATPSALRTVVSPIDDTTGAFQDPADLEFLDSTLRAAIYDQTSAGSKVGHLESPTEPCDRSCKVSRARQSGARILVAAEIRRFAGAYLVVIEIIRTDDAKILREIQTNAVETPPALLAALRVAAAETAEELAGIANPNRVAAVHAAPSPLAAGGHAVDMRNHPTSGVYRSRRNVGVGLFLIGILIEGTGGLLWGLGSAWGNVGLLYSGIAIEAVGTGLFFGGLGVWISNQVRLNRAERGVPQSRALRLEGLSPVIAFGNSGAPGLGGTFSF